jgi:hypothetical protein
MLILACLLWAYDGTNRLENVGCISRAFEEGDQRGTGHSANQGVTLYHDMHSPFEFRKLLYAHCGGKLHGKADFVVAVSLDRERDGLPHALIDPQISFTAFSVSI